MDLRSGEATKTGRGTGSGADGGETRNTGGRAADGDSGSCGQMFPPHGPHAEPQLGCTTGFGEKTSLHKLSSAPVC